MGPQMGPTSAPPWVPFWLKEVFHQRNISDRPQPIVFRTRRYFIYRRCLSANSFLNLILRAFYLNGNSLNADSATRRCIIQIFDASPGPHQGHAAQAARGAGGKYARWTSPPQGAALTRAPRHHRGRVRAPPGAPVCAGRGRRSIGPGQASQPVVLSVGPPWLPR